MTLNWYVHKNVIAPVTDNFPVNLGQEYLVKVT